MYAHALLLGSLLAAPTVIAPVNFQLHSNQLPVYEPIVVTGQRIPDQRLPDLPDFEQGKRGLISLGDHVDIDLRLGTRQRGRMPMPHIPRARAELHHGLRWFNVGVRVKAH